jgi:hypothetical protein
VTGFEDDLAGERSDRRRARCDEHSSKPWDRRVTREDDDGPRAYLGQLANR